MVAELRRWSGYKTLKGAGWIVDMASKRFSVEAMVRSYHVYKDVWKAAVKKELRVCDRDH